MKAPAGPPAVPAPASPPTPGSQHQSSGEYNDNNDRSVNSEQGICLMFIQVIGPSSLVRPTYHPYIK